MTQEYLGWHFLREPGKLRDGSPAEPVGGVETFDGKLRLCESGLHASARALDALGYANGAYVRRVRLFGEVIIEGDKAVASKREILAEADATETLHLFACDEAERAMRERGVDDRRSWAAVETKRKWLRGEATDGELAAARAAAWAAAWDAAWAAARDAAWDAAWDAARAAAWAAAWDAARAAAWDAARAAAWAAAWDAARAAARAAAWAAARAAARDAQNERLEAALSALLGIEVLS